jgi:hypothetical protein
VWGASWCLPLACLLFPRLGLSFGGVKKGAEKRLGAQERGRWRVGARVDLRACVGRAGFEGGQMPLYRRLPKLVGKGLGRDGHQKANFGLLKLSVLNKCADNSEVPSLPAVFLQHSQTAVGSQ